MRTLAWMARLAMAAVLVSGCSMYATWVTVQTYLDKVLAQYGISGPAQKAQFSEFLAQMAGNLNIMNQPASKKAGESKPGNGADKADAASTVLGTVRQRLDQQGAGAAAKDSSQPTGGSHDLEPAADALPVWSQNGQQQKTEVQMQSQAQSGGEKKSDSADQRKKVVVSTEQLQQTKDNLTNDDKLIIFSLLVSKLPQSELQKISELMEDGITSEELKQMEDIVEMYLTPSDYKQLLTILGKY